MVTASTDTIELTLTIDKAELERQLRDVFPGGAGGAGRSPKSAAARARTPMGTVDPGATMSKMLKPLLKLGAMAFGIGVMVKNSKILGATMSAMGTIMGSMMDMVLLPLLPVMTKLLAFMASAIPTVQENAAAVGNAVSDTSQGLKQLFGSNVSTGGKVKNAAKLSLGITADSIKMVGQSLLPGS